ncbi:hypothetical protein AXF42_Ash004252 [Apostasia shenzhenica]|uniref:BAH domain-containing protein n=1 Tax=Apostasia shenzhenica TaxID=1088818 RepID=A0A2I0A2C1_9ASPA|nr:hypothetical protein AXF42_Ash004252 [Apostasia shenzhenica]
MAASVAASFDFLGWREDIISQERGSRVVHYFLDDSLGKSHLAVVGTERSLRHMLYVVSEEFYHSFGPDKSGVSSLKWRSRREVVDWLSSFLPPKVNNYQDRSKTLQNGFGILGAGCTSNGLSESGGFLDRHMDLSRRLKSQNSDIVWSGISWTCAKQLKHFPAFCRNGTTIFANSFVLVMSEGENRYLAYLEDMYEDKKGQKKVKVRWFHQDQEFACAIPPPTPHPNEVFITPYSQVISAECVDDVATILSSDHYEKCLATSSYSSSTGIRLCFRQYSKKKFKFFDLTTLRGYFNQPILSSLDICSVSGEELGNGDTHGVLKRSRFIKYHNGLKKDHLGMRISINTWPECEKLECDLTAQRPMSVKFIGPRNQAKLPFDISEKIELLCQDSGIRGCWFSCSVVQISHSRLKVQYKDVQNEDDCGNLEEWVPAYRVAASDKLGMRLSGRFTIRPCPEFDNLPETAALQIGTAVDAWWNDGWWEGVVIGVQGSGDDSLQVYFPGEDFLLSCSRSSVRISKDWSGNRWVSIDPKPDILSHVTLVSPGAKLNACSLLAKVSESGSSAMSDREANVTKTNSNEEDKQAEGNEEYDRAEGNEEYERAEGNEEYERVEGNLSVKTNVSVEPDEQSRSRKRCRDEANNGLLKCQVDEEDDEKASS